jgi:hypothetical protein
MCASQVAQRFDASAFTLEIPFAGVVERLRGCGVARAEGIV